jgi:hypothetical protein
LRIVEAGERRPVDRNTFCKPSILVEQVFKTHLDPILAAAPLEARGREADHVQCGVGPLLGAIRPLER